jgi:DNA-binding HxlR family transcriptional regulator
MDGVATLDEPIADRSKWRTDRCSVARALDVVGTRSALLLMREAFYGTRRFDDFAERAQITEAVAAARLRELVAAGLLERVPYREPGQRTRHEYQLTEKGRDLYPALHALAQWGDKYLADASGPPLLWRHQGCDEPVEVRAICAAGHDVPLSELVVRSARRSRR